MKIPARLLKTHESVKCRKRFVNQTNPASRRGAATRSLICKQKQAGRKTTGGYHKLRDAHASGARKGNRVGRSWLVTWVDFELPLGMKELCFVNRVGKKDVEIRPVTREDI